MGGGVGGGGGGGGGGMCGHRATAGHSRPQRGHSGLRVTGHMLQAAGCRLHTAHRTLQAAAQGRERLGQVGGGHAGGACSGRLVAGRVCWGGATQVTDSMHSFFDSLPDRHLPPADGAINVPPRPARPIGFDRWPVCARAHSCAPGRPAARPPAHSHVCTHVHMPTGRSRAHGRRPIVSAQM